MVSLPVGAEAPSAADARATRLHKALEAAREALKQEQQRIAAERKALDHRLEAMGAADRELTEEVIDLKLAVSELRKEETAAEDRREAAVRRAAEQQSDQEKLKSVLADALERLDGHLASLIPSSKRAEQTKQIAELREELERGEPDSAFLAQFFALLRELLAEGRSSEAYEARFRTADGIETTGTILRIGHVARAYVAPGGKVGLALRAPDGEGYRWQEHLSEPMKHAILSAEEGLRGQATEEVVFPVDVSRSIVRERRTGKSDLEEKFRSGGLVMYPLAAVAILALLLFIERFWFFSREGRASSKHARTVLEYCEKGEVGAAETYCERKRGPVVRALHTCLRHRDQSVVAMEDSIQEAILHELPRLERFLSTLSILATVAPLLGLLGTVTGMIHTFDMITVHGSGDPRMMAGGISEALMTTATGLIVAIPILLIHNILAGKTEQLTADTERYAASLLVLLRDRRVSLGPEPATGALDSNAAAPEEGAADA